jgi:hypothetical protein
MKNQLENNQIDKSSIQIYYDDTAAIYLSKIPILNARANHIKIKHHFIRDYI